LETTKRALTLGITIYYRQKKKLPYGSLIFLFSSLFTVPLPFPQTLVLSLGRKTNVLRVAVGG